MRVQCVLGRRRDGREHRSVARLRTTIAGLALIATGCSTSASSSGSLPSIPGTPCASPVDLTHATSFEGDTCDGGVSVSLQPCAASAPATVFGFEAIGESWRRRFHVTDGFVVLTSIPAACTLQSGNCDGGGEQGTSGAPQEASYVAVARSDGSCGPFRLDVYNASSCADPADGGSCTCGNSPACASGQTCITPPQSTGQCSQ